MARISLFSFLKAPAHKHRRIVLLFTLGIVLPSTLLGFLAFRGIQNDRALLEKERLEANRKIADQVTREVDEKIRSVESALEACTVDSGRENSGPGDTTIALQQFKSEHPLVEEMFVLRPNGIINYPAAQFLYLPDKSDESLSDIQSPSTKVARAQRLEFREKNYPEALAAYQQLLTQSANERGRGEMLISVARVEKKSGLLQEAAATYEKISHDYGSVVISDGIPLGPASRLERASIFKELNNAAGAGAVLLELYRSLLRPEWVLEKAKFDFFRKQIIESLQEILDSAQSPSDFDSMGQDLKNLETEEKKKREKTERAITFKTGASPVLATKLSENGEKDEEKNLRMAVEVNGYPYLVSILKSDRENPEQQQEIWGFTLSTEKLVSDILQHALLRYVPDDNIPWAVKDREGNLLLTSNRAPSEPAAVQTYFADRFPEWTLEFYQQPANLIGTFFGLRRGIYSYMFLLIGGILAFGLVLTIHTVSHELELARMKSDLVSTISHEFKSPLAAIRQLAEMLHSGRLPSEERRQKYYDILLEQSERLSLLIDNVLNLARIEEGRKEFFYKESDLGTLIQEVVFSMQEQVGHEGFEIGFESGKENVRAEVDRESLSHVLANLLDNAVKYSGDSRKIVVRLSAEDGHAVIEVCDTGVGIRKEEQERIFDRFYRCGDELTRTVRGTGLGLSLVKEIVEAHKGSVHVESEPGKGSAFSVRLPLKQQEEE
jgi:signal transduction histidine kinase